MRPNILTLLMALGLFTLSACKAAVPEINDMCQFDPADEIAYTVDPKAEHLFQLGRAHDVDIKKEFSETIPANLRDRKPDRKTARDYYKQAADLGHTGAMNNLAVYLQNGWGQGRGNYEEDHIGAYNLNVEMARRGDPAGYFGVGAYLIFGRAVPQDQRKGEACLVEAASRQNVDAAQLLAQIDLKLLPDDINDAPDPRRIPRGVTLLEYLGARGVGAAFGDLSLYHHVKTNDLPKRELYAQEAAISGEISGVLKLEAIYHPEHGELPNAAHKQCLRDLKPDQLHDLLTLCPRPDGALTRADADLPPRQTPPIDIKSYLADFAARNPDL